MKSGNNYYDPVRIISNNSITYFLSYERDYNSLEMIDHHYLSSLVQKYNMKDDDRFNKYLVELKK